MGGTHPRDVAVLRGRLAEILQAPGRQAGPLLPVAPGQETTSACAHPGALPQGTDILLRTSGSTTGTGRLVAMSAAALLASARSTHARLGGPGTWALALPSHHVAGLQILVRGLVAGTDPVVVDTSAGFRPPDLARELERARATAQRLYTSLVPTQLLRALEHPGAVAALARADAVLLGGAAPPPGLVDRARQAGIAVVTTYGMSETGGGCLYDGVPLDGVEVALDAEGRVLITGPVLAQGYAHPGGSHHEAGAADPAPGSEMGREPLWRAGERLGHRVAEGFHTWRRPAGRGTGSGATSGSLRVLATSDRGRLACGRLQVLGRMDGVIITGGIKVEPSAVEAALLSIEGVAQAAVVGLPDAQWGSAVVAAVVPAPGARLDERALRLAARARLDGAHAPKAIAVLDELPLRGPGKVDAPALRRILADRLDP
ncbi:AMP-binding protein [Actinomyces slackii]|uniref:2-succinylbenzoate--CoA ligase n=1 Tax=Actinomyces slackii TaxID=52774 RepID=A0A3S4SRF5_9ACTO|nr:2-succinylbenzoate--CoA ligase [Actinomyces slackii]